MTTQMKKRIEKIYFENLKGLHDIEICFEKPLTAIMGVNGAGKSTVIHALACVYQAEDQGETYRFPMFFPPNTDSTWANSCFVVKIEDNGKPLQREYRKNSDRWSPRYDSRPKRDVYYIGIDSCLPDIERFNTSSFVSYVTKSKDDKLSKNVIEKAATILNKDYELLTENNNAKHKMIGVKTKSGLKYSSLSMGCGEQRIIRILQTVYSASAFSLILIDEMDLLLHDSALKKLIDELYNIAVDRKLQIVFTTHSSLMSDYADKVGIQFIHQQKESDKTIQIVYSNVSNDLICALTGERIKPLEIYVEDYFAKALVQFVAYQKGMAKYMKVITFGSIENAFVLASAFALCRKNLDGILILLDGDRHRSITDKRRRINNILSGTESDAVEKREKALSLISQFNLPEGKSPEEYIFEMIKQTGITSDCIYQVAQGINHVSDKHDYLRIIIDELGVDDTSQFYSSLFNLLDNTEFWSMYVNPLEKWLNDKKAELCL